MKFIKENISFILLAFSILIFLVGIFVTLYFNNKIESKFEWLGLEPEQNRYFKTYAYVSGEVLNPGVYEFIEGERIAQIIEKAGGFTELADSNFIAEKLNLSGIVKDEQHIHIPQVVQNISSEVLINTTENNETGGLININTSDISTLESLPGIGPVTAQKIIDGRPYEAIDDLLDVSGIGEKTFEVFKDLITVN